MKEERNLFKDQSERYGIENKTLKEELDKMKEMCDKLRNQVKHLRNDISMRKPQIKSSDATVQTEPIDSDEEDSENSDTLENDKGHESNIDDYLNEFLSTSLNGANIKE